MTQHGKAKEEQWRKGNISHRRRPTNISDGFSNQGRAKRLPCGGMPKKGWYTDSDADAFL